ncbi:uncharacterized protein with HEPN domain [Sphingomonas sp. BE138]|uniref:HepT-like ribonuclease domain-containing protein n=1 Tax=Sphingomonas sp. BE138 TaxID=2817845 RepID=UPI002855ED7B|nr:HepT-like ribonuclease domain-containing protein [Sphingomonas sp. BE138]MDR6788586.1 uncharacterized protein with HEPN domain [Sphingomonas sp. BE138]
MSSFSDRTLLRLRDVVDNADRVAHFVGDMSFAAFAADSMRVDAVERCIERVAEALVQIGADELAVIAPTVSLAEVRGIGNRLRHEYRHIDMRVIFDTARDDLPELRTSCAKALER